jgi:sugar (pentulose or hexulose) kinase
MIAWLRRFIGSDADLDRLNHEAAALPAGADELVVLDHFQGNRMPHTDALSRGALVGLSLGHGTRSRVPRDDGSHLLRHARDPRHDERAGLAIDEIVVGGGATRSPLWLQIHADTARRPSR